MKEFIFIAVLSCSVVMGILISDTKPANMSDHVTKLEQTITELHTEQKTTAGLLKSLSNEIVSMKSEMRLREKEFWKVNSTLTKLESENAMLRAHLNLTVLDSLGSDVKTCLNKLHKFENSSSASFKDLKDDFRSLKNDVLITSGGLLTVEDTVARLDKEIAAIKNGETERNMSKVLETDLRSTQKELKSTVNDLQDIRNNLTLMQSELQAYSNLSVGSPSSSKRLDIYYQVQLKSDQLSVAANDTIVFDNALANVGGGYNALTGLFTASESGVYLLWADVLGTSTGDTVLEILLHKEGIMIAGSSAKISHILGLANTASLTTITHLRAGERVWYTGTYSVNITGALRSGFGGVLLSAQ